LKIYEFEVKEIFKNEGLSIPQGRVISSPVEASNFVRNLGKEVAVKSQVHVGGRGKAGGIKFASLPEEAASIASELIGSTLKGERIKKILIEEKLPIKKEFYLGITVDRRSKKNILIFTPSGGMDIEEISNKEPEKITKIYIDPLIGIQSFHLNHISKAVDYNNNIISQLKEIARKLYRIYEKYDCLIVEINPLVLSDTGNLMALDGKLEMDDNARYRQEELMNMWDEDKEDPLELIGTRAGFVVIKLKGSISLISNGAGLALSTIDLLHKYGSDAANILDLGGGAKAERVKSAVNVVIQDKDVKGILFNIFGGITRCDEIAKGVTMALYNIPGNLPVVCRLQGTNREEGINILKKAGLNAVADLEEAVKQIIRIIKRT